MTDQVSVALLIVGGTLLVAATVAALLTRTRGLPPGPRLGAMARLAVRAVARYFPYRLCAGVAGFMAGAIFTSALLWGLLRWYASGQPQATEASPLKVAAARRKL